MKKTRTLTRNSFKRKILVFGASIFASLALFATGFAAWVISNNATADINGGNVTVGVTDNASVEIKDLEWSPDGANSIYFEPVDGDVTGRVRHKAGDNAENLAVKFTYTLTQFEYVVTHDLKIAVPVSIHNAIEAGYITLPGWTAGSLESGAATVDYTIELDTAAIAAFQQDSNANTLNNGSFKITKSGNNANVEFTLQFGWGDYFGGMNPSTYYDTEDSDGVNGGADVADDQLKTQLDTFRAMVYGVEYNDYKEMTIEQLEALTGPTFVVTINAGT